MKEDEAVPKQTIKNYKIVILCLVFVLILQAVRQLTMGC